MAERNFGTAFYLGTTASATPTPDKIAEVLSVKRSGYSRGTIDTTTHDSVDGNMEFMGEGVRDPGELTIQIHYVPGSDSDTKLLAALASPDSKYMKVLANGRNGATAKKIGFAGLGILTGYEPDDQPVQGKQSATLTIKASGSWAHAAEA